jgi:hypothetical protein
MATQEQVDKIIALANGLIETPIDKLVSNVNWGTINFEAARTDLNLLFNLCNHIIALPISILPNSVADAFSASITQAGQTIQLIRTFDIESASPTGQRDQIIAQVKQFAEHLLVTTQSWIHFLAYQKGDIQKNIDALSQAVKDANKILDGSKKEVAEKSDQITEIVTAAREASASAGVGVFTRDFEGQATSLEGVAKRWLWATIGLAVVTLIAAFASFFFPIAKDASNAQIVQYMTSKLVVLLVLITATVWCGRIYKALKHQVTVNSHRANSLKTFQAFVKAASDDNTRDAVLLETTRSIFSFSPSGYLESNDASPDTTTKVLEIFKSAGGVK